MFPSTFENLISKEINFKIDNIEKEKYHFLKISYLNEEGKNYSVTERIENSDYIKGKFFNLSNVTINENIQILDKRYILRQGEHIIKKPIIIPRGHELVINEGTTLKMLENTYIMVKNGVIRLNGTKEKPISIKSISEDIKWKGIYVNSSFYRNKKSILKNVNISNFSFLTAKYSINRRDKFY